jgi:tetratricopeptide (TPR) repeat protein
MCAEHEGTTESYIEEFAFSKTVALDKLKRFPESAAFLRELLNHIPDSARLRRRLSGTLRTMFCSTGGADVLEEAISNATKAVLLRPDEFEYSLWLSSSLFLKGDNALALRHGKHALALASRDVPVIVKTDSGLLMV